MRVSHVMTSQAVLNGAISWHHLRLSQPTLHPLHCAGILGVQHHNVALYWVTANGIKLQRRCLLIYILNVCDLSIISLLTYIKLCHIQLFFFFFFFFTACEKICLESEKLKFFSN